MKSVSIAVREDAVAPLDRWLATELEQHLGRPVPRSLCRKAIASGLVAVAGRETRDPGYRVTRGRSVFVRTLDWLPEARVVASPTVLFEDEWLLALDKPAGLPTHETADPTRASLTAFAERHVGRRVFVHHRLDAETSRAACFSRRRPRPTRGSRPRSPVGKWRRSTSPWSRLPRRSGRPTSPSTRRSRSSRTAVYRQAPAGTRRRRASA